MSQITDRLVGTVLLAVSVTIFLYYTLWVLVTPFLDSDHILQPLFPDRYYALAIPLGLLLTAVTGVTGLLGVIMMRTKSKSKAKTS